MSLANHHIRERLFSVFLANLNDLCPGGQPGWLQSFTKEAGSGG